MSHPDVSTTALAIENTSLHDEVAPAHGAGFDGLIAGIHVLRRRSEQLNEGRATAEQGRQ